MRDLLEYLIGSLVEDKSSIEIRETAGEKNVAYLVKVAPNDMGRVIGRGGKTANALRIIMSASGGINGKDCWLDFHRSE